MRFVFLFLFSQSVLAYDLVSVIEIESEQAFIDRTGSVENYCSDAIRTVIDYSYEPRSFKAKRVVFAEYIPSQDGIFPDQLVVSADQVKAMLLRIEQAKQRPDLGMLEQLKQIKDAFLRDD